MAPRPKPACADRAVYDVLLARRCERDLERGLDPSDILRLDPVEVLSVVARARREHDLPALRQAFVALAALALALVEDLGHPDDLLPRGAA